MECPSCHFQNIPGLTHCARCQSLLDFKGIDIEPPRNRGWWRRRITTPRRRLTLGLFRGVFVVGDYWRRLTDQNLGLSLVCLIPGLPHLRARHRVMGWGLLMSWGVLLLLSLLTVGTWGGMYYIAAASVHAFALLLVFNAHWRRLNQVERAAVGLAVFFAVNLLVYYPLQRLIGHWVTPIAINNIGQAGVLQDGDVLLNLRPGASHPYQRGEVVLYQIYNNRVRYGYVVHRGVSIDRIIGLPGDHVVVHDGYLWVNGDLVPVNRLPLGGLHDVTKLDVTVAADCYLIFPSQLFLHGAHGARTVGGDVRAQMTLDLLQVRQSDVTARVWIRVRPWLRLGPLE